MLRKSKFRFLIFVLISNVILLFPLMVRAQTPINCGQTLAGTISAPAETDSYTFSGTANDGITIRVRKTSGTLSAYLSLYGPGGGLITSTGFGQIDRTLTETGTYRIDVRDSNNTNTGNYLLYWERMSNPCNVAAMLACEQVAAGSVGTSVDPPPWRIYTFTASANDKVTIRTRKTSGAFTPQMELYNPSGVYVAAGSQLDRTLTAAGTYTILMRDYSNVNAGNYVLTWWRLVNPCTSTPISCGQALSGTIGAADEIDMYTFTGAVNDKVMIRTRKTSGTLTVNAELYNPSGTRIWGPTGDPPLTLVTTLTAAGTYTILVRDSSYVNTGDYVVYLEKMSSPCNVAATLACDQVVAGSIGTSVDPPPWRIYTFAASANDKVTIRTRKTSGTSFSQYMELYNPSASMTNVGSQIDTTLTTTGTYTILVRDSSNAYAGDYVVSWRRVVNPCTSAPINCGQVLSGTIGEADEIDMYTFTGAVNDKVMIRTRKTSGNLTPNVELYNPSGTRIWGPGSETLMGPITLTTAGTYTFLMRDQNNTDMGDYLLYWEKMNNPCNVAATLACDQVVAGSIGVSVDPPPWRVYRFVASANDSVTIRMSKTSILTFTPLLELYGPTGDIITSTSNFELDRVLTTAGTYTLLLRDSSNAYAGDYLLTWQRANNPCNPTPLSCGQVIADSMSIVEVDAYTLTASAGDNVVLILTRTSGGLDPYLELYNSAGTRIAYQYTTSGNQATITQTLSGGGSYTVFASDYSSDETGSYTLKFQKNNNYCPEVTVTAPNGGEFVKGGSSFTITWTSSSPRGVSSHEIRLSMDGGQTFPNVIATGLGGSVQSFDWSVPTDINNAKARIRVTATDTSGMSTPDDSDIDFVIYQGINRTYVYDELSRLIRIIYEDGKIVNYTYDAAGNRITMTEE